jgi:glycerol-1-phosphate dehydrogenase [NAD(P)+]
MGIAGSSRPASGAEHKFSHALDRIAPKPALHGEQCGVGTIMMAYLHGITWEDKRDALATIGAPTTAKQLGIEDQHIIQALKEAHTINPDRYTILGDRGITEEAAERLARITGVIG